MHWKNIFQSKIDLSFGEKSAIFPHSVYDVPVKLKLQYPPSPGNWTFEDRFVEIPSPRGKKVVQMPHQLVLKYLSSKANFVFNQTLFPGHCSCFSEGDLLLWHLQT